MFLCVSKQSLVQHLRDNSDFFKIHLAFIRPILILSIPSAHSYGQIPVTSAGLAKLLQRSEFCLKESEWESNSQFIKLHSSKGTWSLCSNAGAGEIYKHCSGQLLQQCWMQKQKLHNSLQVLVLNSSVPHPGFEPTAFLLPARSCLRNSSSNGLTWLTKNRSQQGINQSS